jgi:hypothetical protein
MAYTQGLPPSLINTELLIPGRLTYLLGYYSAKTSPTLANITNISAAVNTVTITVGLTAGNAPTTAQLLTVQNASNSAINAVSAPITAVTGFNGGDNSVGTIAYTVTGVGTIVSVAGSGQVVMPVAEVPDVLQNGSSLSVAMPFNDPRIDQSRTIVVQASCPSAPTTATINLSASDDNVTFYTLQTVLSYTGGTAAGGMAEIAYQSVRFLRFDVSNVTGGSSPTVIARISA